MAVVAAVAAIVGAAVSIYGQIEAGNAQARAEDANAAFYKEQSEFARRAMMREYSLYNDQAADFTGEVISQPGKGGVDLSGSTLLALSTVFARQESERQSILENGAFQQREADLRAEASRSAARNIRSSAMIGAVATGLGGVSNAAGSFSGGAKKNNSSWMSAGSSNSPSGGQV